MWHGVPEDHISDDLEGRVQGHLGEEGPTLGDVVGGLCVFLCVAAELGQVAEGTGHQLLDAGDLGCISVPVLIQEGDGDSEGDLVGVVTEGQGLLNLGVAAVDAGAVAAGEDVERLRSQRRRAVARQQGDGGGPQARQIDGDQSLILAAVADAVANAGGDVVECHKQTSLK